jgi:hypothetical protein
MPSYAMASSMYIAVQRSNRVAYLAVIRRSLDLPGRTPQGGRATKIRPRTTRTAHYVSSSLGPMRHLKTSLAHKGSARQTTHAHRSNEQNAAGRHLGRGWLAAAVAARARRRIAHAPVHDELGDDLGIGEPLHAWSTT